MLWIALCVLLVIAIAAAFSFPHEMVSPGNLIPAHAGLQDNCFACHMPFRGPSAERCITCHTVDDIGKKTTKGVPIVEQRPIFHQALISQNCMACHSDHPRPRLISETIMPFAHEMLRPDLRNRCIACHIPPRDQQHRGQSLPCAQCHQTQAWKPSTFNHDGYFQLDRNHQTACVTCHLGAHYERTTCFGCHAHQPDQTRVEHLEEGISNIDNCVQCHRAPDAEPAEQRDNDD